MYSISYCILRINRFFNKNVFPPSPGPDITHLKLFGNEAATTILSSSHDCRLPSTSINKLDLLLAGEGALGLVGVRIFILSTIGPEIFGEG